MVQSLVNRVIVKYLRGQGYLVLRANPLRQLRRKILRRVQAATDNRVASGPFRGMLLDSGNESWRNDLAGMLLGIYESELHEAIEEGISRNPTQVVNLGCGDGYYAVGMATRLPEANVIAIDINEKALSNTSTNSKKNGIDSERLALGTELANFSEQLTEDSLWLVDIEGAEVELVDPDKFSVLRSATMIIETHDFKRKNSAEIIRRRFNRTHKSIEIVSGPRNPNEIPILANLPDREKWLAMSEGRPQKMVWLFLTPLLREAE